MKNKVWNKKYLFTFAFLCIFLIGGVFAYWTQELQVRNEFKTAKYDTTIVEEFTAPSEWLPGQEVNKDVSVRNKGTIPVFVRVSIHQKWVRREDVYGGILYTAADHRKTPSRRPLRLRDRRSLRRPFPCQEERR